MLECIDLSSDDITEILRIARAHREPTVRKKDYELGLQYFGKDYIKPALSDKNKNISGWANAILSGAYSKKGGRRKKIEDSNLRVPEVYKK